MVARLAAIFVAHAFDVKCQAHSGLIMMRTGWHRLVAISHNFPKALFSITVDLKHRCFVAGISDDTQIVIWGTRCWRWQSSISSGRGGCCANVVKGKCGFPGFPEIHVLKQSRKVRYVYFFRSSPLSGYPGRIPKLDISDKIGREEVPFSLSWEIFF